MKKNCHLTCAEENDEDDEGKQGSEVNNFTGTFNTFHHTGEDDEPSQRQTAYQLPPHIPHVFPRLACHTQHSVPKKRKRTIHE